VPEERGGAVLEEITREEHAGIGDFDEDVRIGMPAAEEVQLDLPFADVQVRVLREGPIGRDDLGLGDVLGEIRVLLGDHRLRLVGVVAQDRHAVCVAPDRGRPEHRVPERVVRVPVGVDDERHRVLRQLSQVLEDLAALARGEARVDHEDVRPAEDHADLLVVEAIALREDPVADLDPGSRSLGHARSVGSGRAIDEPAPTRS